MKRSTEAERTRAEPRKWDGASIPAGRPARPRFEAPLDGSRTTRSDSRSTLARTRDASKRSPIIRPVSGLTSGVGSRTRRLPVMTHSGISPRLDSSTVAGAAPALRVPRAPRTDFPFNPEGEGLRGTGQSARNCRVFGIAASMCRHAGRHQRLTWINRRLPSESIARHPCRPSGSNPVSAESMRRGRYRIQALKAVMPRRRFRSSRRCSRRSRQAAACPRPG